MSVLSDLFKDIADAIGEKTGDPDKPLSPASFPTEILSIVTGGSSGGGDGKELRFVEGSFGSLSSTLGRQTISHGLGEKPDFIFVFPSIAGETLSDAQANRFCYAFGFNSRISASVQSAWSGFVSKSTGYTIITSTSANGIDKTTSSERSSGAIYTPNDETFEVGGDTYLFSGNYRWIAVSGIGGTVSGGGSSADVCYVTFCNYDGTYLGKKAVAVGDDCADPFARGVITQTPTKESDAEYVYTFAGWATEPNGGASSTALKEVNTDRTLYASYTGVYQNYVITYYDTDGATVLGTQTLPYGSMPSFEATKEGAFFGGWTPEPVPVTGNASYIVKWVGKVDFATAAWGDIAAVSESGQATLHFAVGDTKEVPITYSDGTSGTLTVAIAGFNHDDLSNGTGKAGISIVCMSLPNIYSKFYNSSSGNVSYLDSNCIIDDALTNKVYPILPEALRAVIKNVSKKVDTTKNSGTSPTLGTVNAPLWILSMVELGHNGTGTSYTSTLGSRYALFPYQDITQTTSPKLERVPNEDTGSYGYYYTRNLNRIGVHSAWLIAQSSDKSKAYAMQSNSYNYESRIRFGFCV